MHPIISLKSPAECSSAEIAEFENALVASGESASPGLSERILRADGLAFLRDERGALLATGALRCPRPDHCAAVFRKAAIALPPERFTLDLHWFTGPEESLRPLVAALTERAGGRPVFVIASTVESALLAALEAQGFRLEGTAYASGRGEYTNTVLLHGQ
jgi:hypothetical protein